MKTAALGLRLFLEGVEVPAISAQISIAPSQPASCSVQLIPTDAALELMPRTLVHLFALKSGLRPEDHAYFEKLSEGKIPGVDVNSRIEDEDTQYQLVFSGEMIGYQYAKTPNSRQLVVQCMDFSIYWDTCYQWFADYSVSGSGLTDKAHNFVGAGQGLFDNIAGGHKWVISQLLNSSPKTPQYRYVRGLLGGLIHLLEAVGGVRPDSLGKGYVGVNEYFTIAELRYNLLGMLGAVPDDTTSQRIYAAKAFHSWLKQGMSSMGNLISFRDILRHVGRYIFHDVYPNPAPYFSPPGNVKGTTFTSIFSDTANGGLVVSNLRAASVNLGRVYDKFYKLEASGLDTYITDYGWGLHEAKSLVATSKASIVAAKDALSYIKTSDVAQVRQKIEEALVYTDAAEKEFSSVLMGGFAGGIKRAAIKARKSIGGEKTKNGYSAGALKAIADILRRSAKGIGRRKVGVSLETGSHLYTQLLLPETFFVAPPRCNVLFPDQVYNFTYSRNFMREVTRLSCKGGMGMIARGRGARLLSRSYFAPSIRDANGKTLYATLGYGHRILLPHEIHSGIVPRFEWVTSGHRWGTKAARARKFKDKFYQAGKVGYIQRLAHFQFYLHRWSSRTMSVQSVFNPNLVIGLPGLVIDRKVPSDEVQKAMASQLGREAIPTQYLGKVSTITHSISQSGGMTSVNFTHCRTHRGVDDEFLGALMREKTARRRTSYKIDVERLATQPESYGSKAKELAFVVKRYKDGKLTKGSNIGVGPIKGRVYRVDDTGEKVKFALPFAKNLGFGPNDVLHASGWPAGYIELPTTLTVMVERFVASGELARTNLSVEDALMPGWYSDVWWKENISKKVYLPLLGIRAITDDKAVYEDNLADQLKDHEASKKTPITRDANGNMTVEEIRTPDLGKGTIDVIKLDVPVDTLEKAIDGLAMIYSIYKQRGLDVHEFINNYTARPIANLVEVLGSQNLVFQGGGVKDPNTMTEGFHSRAFGEYNADMKIGADGRPVAGQNALEDLPEGTFQPLIPRGGRSRAVKIPKHLDPRGRARARVVKYMRELEVSRGLLGV